jgi:hypothetical protein
MNQLARIDYDLPPAALAQMYFRDGADLGSNPFPKGCSEYECFMLEMARLQNIEFRNEQEELRAGV